jgi:hypothetical protein
MCLTEVSMERSLAYNQQLVAATFYHYPINETKFCTTELQEGIVSRHTNVLLTFYLHSADCTFKGELRFFAMTILYEGRVGLMTSLPPAYDRA